MKKNGFTLLELLLAMAIFSMISIAGYSLLKTVINSEESARFKTERLSHLQTTFLLMERDFNQIARRHIRLEGEQSSDNFIHASDSSFNSDLPLIAFVRYGWTNPNLMLPRSDLQSVAYRLNEGVLERLHYNFVDVDLGEEPKVRPLIDKVEDVHFEYFYNKAWQKELIDQKLPLAIAVEINLTDLGKIRRQFLVAGDK
jgi:general secretion pathway protein J